jgi:hypothetical protein
MRRGGSRLGFGALAVGLAFALAGCGAARHPSDATAENNGYYVTAGQLYYQLQVSRELNQFATEDAQYLTGLPSGTAAPSATQLWYGVFLRAMNNGNQPHQSTDSFDIKDTQGNKYFPLPLNSTANEYAWTSMQLGPHGVQPGPDTTAFSGPTQGSELLFKLSTSVYNNRPLTLEIHVPGSSKISQISLDL